MTSRDWTAVIAGWICAIVVYALMPSSLGSLRILFVFLIGFCVALLIIWMPRPR